MSENRIVEEELGRWVAPETAKNPASALVIAGDSAIGRFTAVTYTPSGWRPVGSFRSREDAQRASGLMEDLLSRSASARIGGPGVLDTQGTSHPGVEWIAMDAHPTSSDGALREEEVGRLTRMWVLPATDGPVCALRDAGSKKMVGQFPDEASANEFIRIVDQLMQSNAE